MRGVFDEKELALTRLIVDETTCVFSLIGIFAIGGIIKKIFPIFIYSKPFFIRQTCCQDKSPS